MEEQEFIQGKHFSITDPQGVNTVIYEVNKTEKEIGDSFKTSNPERVNALINGLANKFGYSGKR